MKYFSELITQPFLRERKKKQVYLTVHYLFSIVENSSPKGPKAEIILLIGAMARSSKVPETFRTFKAIVINMYVKTERCIHLEVLV